MNKLVFPLFAVMLIASGIFILSSSLNAYPEENEEVTQKEIKAILQNSCYDCHTKGSKNEDALEALNLDTFNKLGKVKKITKLKEMTEMVEEREMPPKKYLDRNPDAKLTDEQIKVFTRWADQEVKKLIGK